DPRYSETVTIMQYPSIIITLPSTGRKTATNNTTTFVNGVQGGNGNSGTSVHVFDKTTDIRDYYKTGWYNSYHDGYYLGSIIRDLGDNSGAGNKNPNMYIIKTTVLDESSSYMLGDPRSTTEDNDLGNRYSSNGNWSASATSVQGGNRRILYYHPTIEDESARNIIAPEFRIASSFGVTQEMTYQGAKERCASYQEFGYPAGRWRLMTFAEASYIARLSSDGKIPTLLSKGSQYWTAGGYVTISTSGAPEPSYETNGRYWVRCVYDEWYWKNTTYPTVRTTTFTWGDTNE
ncbi:MAG: hypothetical protein SPL26_06050, partial [Bacteroidales bacterium]|nr:hypothetical protein [Bacteroidales bacterium]